MKGNTYDLDSAVKIAHFRYGLIAPVINGTYTESSQTAYYKRVASEPLTLPNGQVSHYSYKTLEKWVSDYNRGGIDALMPGARSDKGVSRALGDTAIEEIYRLKEAFPRMNATRIYEQLIQGSFITTDVSVCAVQRFVKHNDLKSGRNPNMRDRKAFEEASFGIMWQADTCHICRITEDGTSRKVYCVMIVDDHSRLITGGSLFYNDNAYNFQKVLKSAISAYGIPSKLLVDNGAPYSNTQLTLICGSVGTVLIHAKVRDGASKAKVERNFRTIKERWLYTLDLTQVHSLKKLNQMFADYIRQHNITYHSGIKETPFSRYQKTKANSRVPISREWLDECFLNREYRRVNKDSTLSIDKVSYDAPMQFIGMRVEIRYLPDAMESAFILYEEERYPIRVTDKNANCYTKRNNIPSIDYTREGALK